MRRVPESGPRRPRPGGGGGCAALWRSGHGAATSGQGIFRIGVTDAYDRACAVTTEHSLPVLEAAHIRPYSEGGEHRVSNGLLLRSDIHRLFDKGYVTVTPDYRFLLSQRLKQDFERPNLLPVQRATDHRPAGADRPSGSQTPRVAWEGDIPGVTAGPRLQSAL